MWLSPIESIFYVGFGAISKIVAPNICYDTKRYYCEFLRISSIITTNSYSVGILNIPTTVKFYIIMTA